MFGSAHVEVQHGIGCPFRFQLFDGQSFEQVFPAFEIAVQRAGQEGFAEPSWTAQKYIFCVGMCHTVHVFRLVNIQIVLGAKLREGLYAYRIALGNGSHSFHSLVVFCKVTKKVFRSSLFACFCAIFPIFTPRNKKPQTHAIKVTRQIACDRAVEAGKHIRDGYDACHGTGHSPVAARHTQPDAPEDYDGD